MPEEQETKEIMTQADKLRLYCLSLGWFPEDVERLCPKCSGNVHPRSEVVPLSPTNFRTPNFDLRAVNNEPEPRPPEFWMVMGDETGTVHFVRVTPSERDPRAILTACGRGVPGPLCAEHKCYNPAIILLHGQKPLCPRHFQHYKVIYKHHEERLWGKAVSNCKGVRHALIDHPNVCLANCGGFSPPCIECPHFKSEDYMRMIGKW